MNLRPVYGIELVKSKGMFARQEFLFSSSDLRADGMDCMTPSTRV